MGLFENFDTQKKANKNLVIISYSATTFPQTIIQALQRSTKQPPQSFHIGYTFATGDNDDLINIYTLQTPSETALALVGKPDLCVYVFDYNDDPHTWIDSISKTPCTEGPVLILVVNQSKVNVLIEQDVHEAIQLALRTVCLKEGYSLLYTSDIKLIRKVVTAKLSGSSLGSIAMSDYRDMFLDAGTDSWPKIAALAEGVTPEELEETAAEWRSPTGPVLTRFKEHVAPRSHKEDAAKTKKQTISSLPTYSEFINSL
ncbi:CYFA0S08e00166g1_1 [Cyberlindnera fabianii]|uniref:CYFA0S08e00166g1_1 n=1 Tax=Cyberlindnera fabianii TaxID=36022 RepID=A0A061AW51_CYBFA|nr:CYFA0S08e00166g1_1 [Cyberlindnera fabianii]